VPEGVLVFLAQFDEAFDGWVEVGVDRLLIRRAAAQ
jgi:hypothetical protein